jgi:hypothetical protein
MEEGIPNNQSLQSIRKDRVKANAPFKPKKQKNGAHISVPTTLL